jgi:O-antigen/teichoic acid export membrane protein
MTDSNNHRNETLKSLKWSGINQVIKQTMNISIGILLARLLNPEDFGLLGMATVITGFIQLFNDFGFGSALIQKKEISKNDIASVFWFNLGTGVFFFLILNACSFFIASFYQKPELQKIIGAISWVFIIQSLSYVQATLFRKQLNFKAIFISDTISMILSGIIALYLAYSGFGVWSLISQLLLNSIFNLILLWLLSSWRPNFIFSFSAIKSMLGFSLPLMGSTALGYILGNLDKLFIGKYLGSASLGLYTRAYSLMVFPVGQVSGVVSQVMFPSLAQIQDDIPRIRQIYIKMNQIISAITFPIMGAAFLLAEPFVLKVLGEQWFNMVPVFKVLTFVGAIQSISTLIGNIYLALGKMTLYLKINFYSGIFFSIASIIGIQFGIMGVTYAFAIATLLIAIPQWIITVFQIDLNFVTYIKSWLPNLIITIGCVAICSVLLSLLNFELSLFDLLLGGPIFVFIYIIFTKFFNQMVWFGFKTLLKSNG